MRQQRTLRNGPDARWHVVVRLGDPVVHRAIGVGLHHGEHLGFARQAVFFQAGDDGARAAQHVAVGGQDEARFVRGAGGVELVERIEIGRHVAIGRVDDGGAAVQDVVAAEQQAVFFEQQAQVVGRVAGRVDDAQGMGDLALRRLSSKREQLTIL